jgi:hypothetical protein
MEDGVLVPVLMSQAAPSAPKEAVFQSLFLVPRLQANFCGFPDSKRPFFWLFFVVVLMALGFELRALHLLGWYFTI